MLIINTGEKSPRFLSPRPPPLCQAFLKEMDVEFRDQAKALTWKERPGSISALTTFTYTTVFTNWNGPGGNKEGKNGQLPG